MPRGGGQLRSQRFQLIRINPIGGDDLASNPAEVTDVLFPTNPN